MSSVESPQQRAESPLLPPDEPDVAEESNALSDLFGSSSDSSKKSTGAAVDGGEVASSELQGLVRVLEPEVPGTVEDTRVESDDEEERHATPIGGPMHVMAAIGKGPDKSSVRLVKMTNFVEVERRPYDPSTYMRDDADMGGFGSQAVMRWRRNEEGEPESNSRFVRWDNGSMSLLIGDECFDVVELAQDNCFLYLRHRSGLMQGMGAIPEKFIFRPAEMKRRVNPGSHTKGPVRQSAKVQKITTMSDPVKEKEEKKRREEERIRDRETLMRKQKKEQQKYYIPQPAPLAGASMGDEEREMFEPRPRSQPRKEAHKRPPRREDVESKRSKKRRRGDFFADEYPEEEVEETNEDMEEPEWNDGEDVSSEGQQEEEAIPDEESEENESEDDQDDSDDGAIGAPKFKAARGQTLVLSDDDDDDDDM